MCIQPRSACSSPYIQYIKSCFWYPKVYKESGIRIGNFSTLHLSQHAPAKIAGISQVWPSPAKLASKKGLHPQLHTVDVQASCHGIAAPAHIAVEPMPQQNIRTTACCIWGSACPICRFLGSIQNHLKMTRKQTIKRNAFLLYICCVHVGWSASAMLQHSIAHTASAAGL